MGHHPMSPRQRKLLQALLYEAIAVLFVGPGLALGFDRPGTTTVPLAIFMSATALAWSYLFNTLFERWEGRQARKGRSLWRRLAHAGGFEGGLVLILVPVMTWWLDTGLLAALLGDLLVLAFFFVYALVFHWAIDRLFGLPASARSG